MLIGVSIPILKFVFSFVIGEVYLGTFINKAILKIVKILRFEVWIKIINIRIFEKKIKFGVIN
jgi:hypothetical protein